MHAVVEFTHNRLLADVELVRASVCERFVEAISHGEVDVTSAPARLDGLAGQDP
jgi:hypothetical protein